MRDLIEALIILLKYGNPKYPTHCEHDVLYINVDSGIVTEEDKQKLEQLGFISCSDENGENIFVSYRYGSC